MAWCLVMYTDNLTMPYRCPPSLLSGGIKRPGREVDHSPPSSAEFKNAHHKGTWWILLCTY
jgi:hypothetical protein